MSTAMAIGAKSAPQNRSSLKGGVTAGTDRVISGTGASKVAIIGAATRMANAATGAISAAARSSA